MRVDDFDYELPKELIAQRPLERRDDSRMLLSWSASNPVGEIRDSSNYRNCLTAMS